jgi:4-hydroxy-tetrahydrodipicolinate synthase
MLHFAYSETNPVAVKSLMRAVDMPAGALRRPLQPLNPQALQVGLDIVRNLELDKKYGYSLKPVLAAAE